MFSKISQNPPDFSIFFFLWKRKAKVKSSLLGKFRRSCPGMFYKERYFLEIVQNSHPCHSLFFNYVAGLSPVTLFKQVFSCKFCKMSKNTFLIGSSGRLLLDVGLCSLVWFELVLLVGKLLAILIGYKIFFLPYLGIPWMYQVISVPS